jgi:hypothetical protein
MQPYPNPPGVAAGVAMDDLVYICTKIARQMDVSGLDRVFDAAEAATAAVEEARPLLARVVELVDEARRPLRAPEFTRSLDPAWRAPCGGRSRGRARASDSGCNGITGIIAPATPALGECARDRPQSPASVRQGASRGMWFVQRDC